MSDAPPGPDGDGAPPEAPPTAPGPEVPARTADLPSRSESGWRAPPSGGTPRRPERGRELYLGAAAGLLATWSALRYVWLVGVGAAFLFYGVASGTVQPAHVPPMVLGFDGLATLALAILLLVRLGRVAPGTRGRARGYTLAISAIVRAIGTLTFGAVVAYAFTEPAALDIPELSLGTNTLPVGETPALWDATVNVTLAQGTFPVFVLGLALSEIAARVEWGAAISCWFLLPEKVRETFWNVFDALLVIAFVAVTLLFPITPPVENPTASTLPAIRLAVTAVAAIRLLFRSLPLVLDAIEGNVGIRMFGAVLPVLGNVRLLVAARLLRARKSGFLTTIGILAICAVTVSSCMMTATLSVMGGFRNDLKRKILGNNAHVVIDRQSGTFEGWTPVLESARAQPHVVAATPYVEGEVMITSATNLAGAVLRGIDPETIGQVTELPRNLRHGQLEYLSHPEQLLRLRPSEMGRGLFEPPDPDEYIDDFGDLGAGETGSVFDDAADLLDESAPPPPPIPELVPSIDPPDAPSDDAEGDDAEGDDAEGDDDSEGDDDAEAPALEGPLDEEAERERIRRDLDAFLLDAPAVPGSELRAGDAGPGSDLGEDAPVEDVLPGLIVGQELARTLRLHVGDEVNVVSPLGELGPAGPMPRSRPFRIAGIFYSGMYEFDMKMAYTALEAGQRFLNVGQAISGIEVKVDETDDAEQIAHSIKEALGRDELRVRGWQEVNRNLFGALQLEKLAMFITLGIAILVASFCIVGTLTLMVQEKRKEVGILKAMGTTSEQVVAIFMAQGLMIGLLGSSVGLGLGYLTCFIMEHYGIALNPEVYYIDRLPVHIDPVEFASIWIAAVVVCLLATIYPAIIGSRLTVVEALRYG